MPVMFCPDRSLWKSKALRDERRSCFESKDSPLAKQALAIPEILKKALNDSADALFYHSKQLPNAVGRHEFILKHSEFATEC